MDWGIGEKIAHYIMRPPRTKYNLDDMGPSTFKYKEKVYERVDFQVHNHRNQKLQCSLFRLKYSMEKRDTIIFLHANSSSRLAVKNYLTDLIASFNIVCFDCSGSGVSDGGYVTLGYYEKEDLVCVMERLKNKYQVEKVILWGRSMGAVTSLLYTAKYGHNVKSLVVDNAFSDLEQVCRQLKDHYISLLPDFFVDSLVDSAQEYIDDNINKKQRINFQIKSLKPKKIVKLIKSPIIYVYSQNDTIVNHRHSKILYEQSNFPKRILAVKGDHNCQRDTQTKTRILNFLIDFVEKQHKYNSQQSINKVFNNFSQKIEKIPLIQQSNQQVNEQQTEIGVVFDSPFNEKLRESYSNFRQNFKKQPSQNDKLKIETKNILQKGINESSKIRQIKSFEFIEEEDQIIQDHSKKDRSKYSLSYSVKQIKDHDQKYEQGQYNELIRYKRRRKKIFQK